MTTDHTRPAPADPRDWYAWLIDPVPTAEFERDYYEQRLLHVRREAPSYYAGLLSVADLDLVLGTHSAGRGDIRLVRGEGSVAAAEYTNAAGRVQPLEVARLFDDGATIVFNQLHQRVPALAQLTVALGRRFSSRVQTNVYLTPPGAQGFAPHWDTHDVFVLQVRGTKRWSIHDTPVRLPLRGQRFEPGTPPGDVREEFELRPGSAAYLPRGLMHSARSTGEASLHVTLGLTAFTWADLLVESVAAAALEEESLRRNLPPGSPARGSRRRSGGACSPRSWTSCSRASTPRRCGAASRTRSWPPDVPLFTDLLGQRLRDDGMTLRSRVRRRAGLLAEAAADGETCVLRFCGRELRLPAGAWPALRFAATSGEEFAVADLPDCLDAAGKLALATRLVREGVLQRSPAVAPRV